MINTKILKYLLIIILLVVSFAFLWRIDFTSYLLTNDNYSPELNTGLSINRYISSPALREYRSLGVVSDSEQADIFRVILFFVFDIVLPKSTLSSIYILICFSSSIVFIYKLLRYIFQREENTFYISILGSIIYITTLFTPWIFNFPVMPFVTYFGFLPLFTYLFVRVSVELNTRNLFLFLISIILLTSSFVISTLFFVTVIIILCLSLFIVLLTFRSGIRKSVYKLLFIIIFFLSTQLFWILPFSFSYLGNIANLKDSKINQSITDSTLDSEANKMTFFNSISFYTTHLDIYENSKGSSKMFTMGDDYYKYDLLKIISYVPFFFSIWGLIICIIQKRYLYLPFWLLLFISLFFIVNENAPFGSIYSGLQNSWDTFRQVFRWPTSKWGNVYLISLTITAAYGFVSVFSILVKSITNHQTIQRILLLVFASIFIFSFLFFGSFLYNGKLFSQRVYAKIPDTYSKLNDYIRENKIVDSRLIVFPPANNGYFREYEWGFYGSGFLHYLLPNPILEKSLSVGSSSSEIAIEEIEDLYYSGNPELLAMKLDKYNVDYILVDRSLIKGRYGFDLDFNLLKRNLERQELVWNNGSLELYRIIKKENDNSKTIFDVLQGTNIHKVENIIEIKEMNASLHYVSTMDGMPIEVQLIGHKLRVTPALPYKGSTNIHLPYKEFDLNMTTEYLSLGGIMLNINNLKKDNIFIDVPYNSIDNIYQVNSQKRSYQKDISKLRLNTCDGEKSDIENIKMIGEKGDISINVRKGLGCLSFSLPYSEFYGVDMKYIAQLGDILGYCIYSNKEQRCINTDKYFNTYSIPQSYRDTVIFENIKGDELSLNIYINAKKATQVNLNEIEITMYTKGLPIGITTSGKINKRYDGSEDSLYIPLLLSKGNYSYKQYSGHIWDYSTSKGSAPSNIDTLHEEIYMNVQNDYISMFNNVTLNKDSRFFYTYTDTTNKSGYPGSLCLLNSLEDRCIENIFFKRNSENYEQISVFSKPKNSNLIYPSYRVTSYSKLSENSLNSLEIQAIPNAWLLIEIEENSFKDSVMMSKSSNLPLYYSEVVTYPQYLSINTSYDNGWKLYKVNKGIYQLPKFILTFVLPILPDNTIVRESLVVDDWSQGWYVEDDGYYLAVFMPNYLGYIGYAILLMIFVLILTRPSRYKYAK